MNDSQSLDELSKRFPPGFVWGVASSAFQIEGAAAADGKGDSIWDVFCRLPGAIADGSDGKIACDHYNRLESDLDLIAGLGVGGYRSPFPGREFNRPDPAQSSDPVSISTTAWST